MKINIVLNQQLDREITGEFYGIDSHIISNYYKDIRSEKDIEKIFNEKYQRGSNLYRTLEFLRTKEKSIADISDRISKLLKYDWPKDTVITVSPAICPIAPRFVDNKSFLVPYFFDKDEIIRICAHEMTHFLYFDKLKDLVDDIDTESPSTDWLISEIVAPCIVNQPELQDVLHNKDSVFVPDNYDRDMIDKLVQLYGHYSPDDIVAYRQAAMKLISQL